MTQDAILYADDWPAFLAQLVPGDVDENGNLARLDATPVQRRGDAGMAYVRGDAEHILLLGTILGVSILAQAETSATSADVIYGAVFSDPAASALYDTAYDRSPQMAELDDGTLAPYTPPPRFGQMA